MFNKKNLPAGKQIVIASTMLIVVGFISFGFSPLTAFAQTTVNSLRLKAGELIEINCEGRIYTQLKSRSVINVGCRSASPTPIPSVTPTPHDHGGVSPTTTPQDTSTPQVNGNAPSGGLGNGSGDGQEVGINLAKLNTLKENAAKGMYDRPCSEAEHDRTKWHTLVNDQTKCHYDHMHFDDPNYVNDIFGEPGAWFGKPGQSISYPWQTFKATTANQGNESFEGQLENDTKHEGYGWIVRRNQNCQNNPQEGMCTTDFRLAFHVHGNMDAPVRYHSMSFEGRVCYDKNDPSSCGIVRTGGWVDFGRLFTTSANDIQCGHGVNEIFIPLAADNLYAPIDRPDSRDEVRCHPYITNLPAYPPSHPTAEWWGHGPGDRLRFQLKIYDAIGNIDKNNPSNMLTFCQSNDPNCRYNQSIASVFIGYVLKVSGGGNTTNGKFVDLDPDGDKVVNLKTFATRWGQVNTNCSSAGLDCIPLEYSNILLRGGWAQYKEAASNHFPCDNCAKVDHDITPSGRPSWIQWFFQM